MSGAGRVELIIDYLLLIIFGRRRLNFAVGNSINYGMIYRED